MIKSNGAKPAFVNRLGSSEAVTVSPRALDMPRIAEIAAGIDSCLRLRQIGVAVARTSL